MKQEHRTKVIINGTNISCTVPLGLAEEGKAKRGEPFQWVDTTQGAGLKIVRLGIPKEEGQKMARLNKDVVFLQEIRRTHGRSQFKLNLPKWIHKKKGLHMQKVVKVAWADDLSGVVVAISHEYRKTTTKIRTAGGVPRRHEPKRNDAKRRAGVQEKMVKSSTDRPSPSLRDGGQPKS